MVFSFIYGIAWEISRHWPQRNKRRNSILMTRHCPDLSSASDWSCCQWNLLLPSRSTYPDLGSDTSSIWNFCARFSNVNSRGNNWWRREMLAVFSSYLRACWPHFSQKYFIIWTRIICNNKKLVQYGEKKLCLILITYYFKHLCPFYSINYKRKYLTIIPRARTGSESIAHDEAEGRMGYWLRGHEGAVTYSLVVAQPERSIDNRPLVGF